VLFIIVPFAAGQALGVTDGTDEVLDDNELVLEIRLLFVIEVINITSLFIVTGTVGVELVKEELDVLQVQSPDHVPVQLEGMTCDVKFKVSVTVVTPEIVLVISIVDVSMACTGSSRVWI
jgi:hypothetical protein